MHLDWRQNLADGDDILQPVYTKSAEPLWSELILCSCPVAPRTKGIEIGVRCFFFDSSEALLSLSTYITNDNGAKSKAPMDSSVCLYFGLWPLQGS